MQNALRFPLQSSQAAVLNLLCARVALRGPLSALHVAIRVNAVWPSVGFSKVS